MQSLKEKLDELKFEANNLKNMYKSLGDLSYTNVLIWGRILINHLQKLENYNKELYNKWFHKYRLEIFGEPKEEARKLNLPNKVIDFFIKERNKFEHEEMLKFKTIMQIKHLSIPKDLGTPPKYAVGSFVDGFGVGWQIKLPDGSTAKQYVHLPEDNVKINSYPINFERIENKTLKEMIEYYVNYLSNMVDDAVRTFS